MYKERDILSEYAIEVRELSKTYGSVKAVQDVSFKVRRGEVFGFLGPNGAGKTTTIKSLLGLIRYDSGLIILNSYHAILDSKRAKREIGYLPEKVAFYDHLTAYQNLCFYADMKGIPRELCKPLLREFGLEDVSNKRVGTFSKGMKQRLGIIRALIGEPSIIILDEPSNGLDPRGVALVRRKILQMKDKGVTVFLSSHILSEIQAVCDRVAIINKGVIVAEDSVENLGARIRLKPRLILKMKDRAEDLVDVVRKIDGVESVIARDKTLEVVCTARAKARVIIEVEGKGREIMDITTEEPSLEKVFLEYTEG